MTVAMYLSRSHLLIQAGVECRQRTILQSLLEAPNKLSSFALPSAFGRTGKACRWLKHDAQIQLQKQSGRHTVGVGWGGWVSQAGLVLTHNVLHLVVAASIPVMFVLLMSKDISSGNADGPPHSGGNMPENFGKCSSRSVRA